MLYLYINLNNKTSQEISTQIDSIYKECMAIDHQFIEQFNQIASRCIKEGISLYRLSEAFLKSMLKSQTSVLNNESLTQLAQPIIQWLSPMVVKYCEKKEKSLEKEIISGLRFLGQVCFKSRMGDALCNSVD